MPDLTLGGVSVRVIRNSWVEKPSVHQGGRQRMRDNTIRSTEDATTRKRIADCHVDLPTFTDEATLRTACPKGVAVAVAGDLPSTGFNALVDIGDVTALYDLQGGVQVLLRAATVHIEES